MKTYIKIITLFVISIFLLFGCRNNSNDEIKEVNIEERRTKNIEEKQNDNEVLFVAISTMISPVETFNLYKDLINYIAEIMQVKIDFKQRKTYGEVNELLKQKQLDFAFICTGAYWEAKKTFPIEILVVPVVEGKPYYKSYIIVHKKSEIENFSDLKGKSFAFTDPISNTGFSYINNYLNGINTSSEKYFIRTIFTYAHDYSIQAVAKKLVDGASVDGLVYEYLKKFQPEKVREIKIIKKSNDFVIPPFVIQPNLKSDLKEKLRNVMINMHKDPKGKEILDKIMIDKFITMNEQNYH